MGEVMLKLEFPAACTISVTIVAGVHRESTLAGASRTLTPLPTTHDTKARNGGQDTQAFP